ncbi:hypothetical protein GEMRC1_009749 [Eukaryota sp. GEM-RC1]
MTGGVPPPDEIDPLSAFSFTNDMATRFKDDFSPLPSKFDGVPVVKDNFSETSWHHPFYGSLVLNLSDSIVDSEVKYNILPLELSHFHSNVYYADSANCSSRLLRSALNHANKSGNRRFCYSYTFSAMQVDPTNRRHPPTPPPPVKSSETKKVECPWKVYIKQSVSGNWLVDERQNGHSHPLVFESSHTTIRCYL